MKNSIVAPSSDKADASESASANVSYGSISKEIGKIVGKYPVSCRRPLPEHVPQYEIEFNKASKFMADGDFAEGNRILKDAEWMTSEIWKDVILNVVTDVGANDMLDKHLAGSAYTAAWYMGLISSVSYTGVPVAGNTMASHSTWTEEQTYSNASRPTTAWASASARSKALSTPLSFNINGTATIKGAFITSVNTKGGTTGILFSAGLFSGGDKAVANLDTLNVSYSATLT